MVLVDWGCFEKGRLVTGLTVGKVSMTLSCSF